MRKTLQRYSFIAACRLFYSVKRIWVRQCIVVYPEPLKPTYSAWMYAMLSGYKIVGAARASAQPPVAYLYHQDSDYQELDAMAINGRCVDITKRKVDEVFLSVFGYSVMLDPTLHHGPAVRKSDANFRHDGMIITCPINQDDIDDNQVYQIFIDNTFGNDLTMQLRVVIVGYRICEVIERYFEERHRFGKAFKWIYKGVGSDVIKEDERDKIYRFCHRLGLEVGELDVLRDNGSGRLYIIDANKTAASGARVAAVPWPEFKSFYRRRAPAFRRYLAERSLASRSHGAASTSSKPAWTS